MINLVVGVSTCFVIWLGVLFWVVGRDKEGHVDSETQQHFIWGSVIVIVVIAVASAITIYNVRLDASNAKLIQEGFHIELQVMQGTTHEVWVKNK